MDLDSLEFDRINNSAARILELCTGDRTVEEISKILSDIYSDEYAKVYSMVRNFILGAGKRGHIVSRTSKSITKAKISGDYKTVIPLGTSIEITKMCPLRCKHCFANAGKPLEDELEPEDTLEVLEILAENGVEKLFVTGGEPFSHPKILEIIDIISSKFKLAIIATSGYIAQKELMAQKIAQAKNIVVQISLDGPAEVQNFIRGVNDSYEHTTKAISTFSEYNVIVSISMTLNPLNKDYVEETIKVAKKLGAREFKLGMTVPLGRAKNLSWGLSKETIEALPDRIASYAHKYNAPGFFVNDPSATDPGRIPVPDKQTSCSAGYILCNVCANGDVTPCVTFPLPLGNILKDDFKKIFGSPQALKFKEIMSPTKELCNSCENLTACNGCHGIAYEISKGRDNCNWRRQFETKEV